jgi:spore coat protein U-like protein
MKRITFILFALIAGTAFGQNASEATGTADVFAEIVTPIEITNGTALNFGSIVAAEGGKVRINTEGTRTFSNSNMDVVSATAITAASFDITAAQNYSYSISIPSTVLKDVASVGVDMPVSFTHALGGETDGTATGSGSEQKLLVGGLLTVAAGQEAGSYEGTVTVTVAYE